jgi:geranylgeranyl reductase family protein
MGSAREEILTYPHLHDVVVIGAGPAGSLTAERLARHGHDVVLLEEHEQPGTPVHCTGLLGVEAFDEFDLPRDLILGTTGAARFWGAAGQSVLVRSDRVQATVIDRAGLDVLLANRATAAGAALRTGCRVDRIQPARDAVTVAGRGLEAPLRARACVLACGANYRFHRQLGLGLPDVFLQSAQLDAAFPEASQVEVRFGREVAPAGFAWLVPFHRGGHSRARIGLMSETHGGERFAAFAASLCERAGVDPALLPAPRRKILPLGPVRRTYADRLLAVGDAAGLVKPTTGGGIYYGLLSGGLAAGVLDRALLADRLTAGHLRRYEARWRQRLGQEIRVGLAFRRVAARLTDESIDSLIDLARVNGVVPLLQQTASFNWHRKAAIALLGHPAFRRIVLKSWAGDGPI